MTKPKEKPNKCIDIGMFHSRGTRPPEGAISPLRYRRCRTCRADTWHQVYHLSTEIKLRCHDCGTMTMILKNSKPIKLKIVKHERRRKPRVAA